MTRIVLTALLPFLLPFLAYLLFRVTVTQAGPWLERREWLLLSVTGLVLMGLSLVIFGLEHRAPADSNYIPPHMEEGRMVPGRFTDGGGG